MCAIFGIVGKYNLESAKRAFNKLSHRGSDDRAIFKNKDLFLAIERLAIESYNQSNPQPIQIDSYILIFNGEIYNYKELAKELGIKPKNEPYVLLNAFLRWGVDFVKKLRGMWAIAIVNIEDKNVWLFRDLVGKKPLYYLYKDGRFIFASELKAILELKKLNFNFFEIPLFLSYGSFISPITIDKDIKKLPPGGRLYFDLSKSKIQLDIVDIWLENRVEIFDEDIALKEVEKRLIESISIRIPKVKWGVLLSGGVDSSLIASIASRFGKTNTFSIGYDEYSNHDERKFAKLVAKDINSSHFEFNFTKKEFFDSLDNILELSDEIVADPAQVPLFYLVKMAKQEGIKVLMGGEGSDELFFGYRKYKEYFGVEKAKELPYKGWLNNYFRKHFSLNREWEWFKRAFEGSVIFRSNAELFSDLQLSRILRMNVKNNQNFKVIESYWENFKRSKKDIITWYSYIDLKILLGEFYLTKIDRVSMAHSIEARSPFLDKELINLAFRIDNQLRFQNESKAIIKKVAKGYVRDDIILRKKKGFNYPFIKWILEEDGEEIINYLNDSLGLFKKEAIEFLLKRGKSGKFGMHLFPLYILGKWAKRYL